MTLSGMPEIRYQNGGGLFLSVTLFKGLPGPTDSIELCARLSADRSGGVRP
jgi:hypothetical protein